MKIKLSPTRAARIENRHCQRALLLATTLACALLVTPGQTHAAAFDSYPAGDDLTTSLGQFQVVLDPAWVKIFDIIITNSPLASTLATKHIRLYHHGVLTSPTLYDPATTIGRSDSFAAGSPQDFAGALAGQAPGRAYVTDGQLVVRPNWPGPTNGVHEVHTFIKSMHLTDSFTANVGFSVKAGMLAPTRPVCAGQVEGGSALDDFPANSFFNVYVVVDLPAGGLLPPIQLVNVDPLLVQQTNILSFPPHIVYQHENSTAVPVYFNNDCIIHDPSTGADIPVARGTIFGQLTLAGHGVGFSSVEIEAFQTEFENESATATMPLNATPITNITIVDFAPDYNAAPRSLSDGHFMANGSFIFTINHLTANTTNYLQVSTDLDPSHWQTLAKIVPATNSFTFVDPQAVNNPRRYYRLSLAP